MMRSMSHAQVLRNCTGGSLSSLDTFAKQRLGWSGEAERLQDAFEHGSVFDAAEAGADLHVAAELIAVRQQQLAHGDVVLVDVAADADLPVALGDALGGSQDVTAHAASSRIGRHGHPMQRRVGGVVGRGGLRGPLRTRHVRIGGIALRIEREHADDAAFVGRGQIFQFRQCDFPHIIFVSVFPICPIFQKRLSQKCNS